ncbi:PD-(D/E)XK nuclease family protein [Allorhodopirellula solitaria]|uniref:PD-(D/E)XK nuclease superfamily protein n=1 Tax=Allorhodopirellula solitaria TaxID=2527987 RepID=A0A5C5WZH1_9BACT|nr:PD-(D/E)XK nuclease family protein [Allorhodopirellula solitaria]TWT55491.1 PD-(D/E)XK nuclease superfamily protein [Allorhodopirellula solitaria]
MGNRRLVHYATYYCRVAKITTENVECDVVDSYDKPTQVRTHEPRAIKPYCRDNACQDNACHCRHDRRSDRNAAATDATCVTAASSPHCQSRLFFANNDMLPPTQLIIRLAPGRVQAFSDLPAIDRIQGGPAVLLEWLETQLGLPQSDVHRAARVMQFADAIANMTGVCFEQSIAADRWETASELLQRRDQLMLCGWDGTILDRCPRIAGDLALAEKQYAGSFPSEAERVAAVAEALDAGQVLPNHELKLTEPIDLWPAAWQRVLSRLNVCDPDEVSPCSPELSSLLAAANTVRGQTTPSFDCDSSLRVAQARSETAAVEFVASVLSNSSETLSRTVVYCEDDTMAVRLDACLQRIGIPTMGASLQTRAHPVLQVLPLALELCWDPVDPQCLLDLLTLPVIPFPRPAASALARALSEEPGLGSGAWQDAFDSLCETSKHDVDHPDKLKERLHEWFCAERSPRGQPIPTNLMARQCRKVAKWAIGRATLIWRDENLSPSDEQVAIALREASRQASLLGDLVELAGESITQPQLGRLLEEVTDRGVESKPCLSDAGGPVRVRSLSEIADRYDRLIWMGTTTSDTKSSRWSVKQLADFAAAGVVIDDGTHALRSLRAAEVRGLCLASSTMLVIELPQNAEERVHPLWLAIREKIAVHRQPEKWTPAAIEDLISHSEVDALSPFVFACKTTNIQPPQPLRPHWDIPANLLRDRESVSASELEDRLACPLKWTLNYQAKLRSSDIASLPDEFRLRGNLFHKILERVFGGGGDLPTEDDAARLVEQTFDERLPLDAAPLAQPEKRVESLRLKNELVKAARLFVRTLSAGGYRSVKIEEPVEGSAFGKELRGSIDCLASSNDGREAVVDFKYAGRKKYYDMVTKGKSVQLATYAFSRSQSNGSFPAVAYLVLSDGTIFTPIGSPLSGVPTSQVIDGPSIERVWNNFATAIAGAEGWLTTDDPVPARPLQSIDDWPDGSELVLIEQLGRGETQSVCRYCDFKRLCGMEVTR